ncbi:hypothetical protein Avbf_02334 [Armadillidium vulgare]|nr:hypothetical protein Avbf_02334 [Armadillidium vulgare]
MSLYEDFNEEAPKVEIEEEEIIPMEIMPNISLPKITLKQKVFEQCSAKVICLEAPNSFYLHLKHQQEYFQIFTRNMNQFYVQLMDPPLNIDNLPLGSTWAAYSSGGWHRAVVLNKVKEEKGFAIFRMRFVDYGYTKLVSLENIKYLEELFTYDPPFALHCMLSQVFPTNKWIVKPWCKAALDKFQEFCFNNDQVFAIFIREKSDEGKWEVILESSDGVIINEELVASKLATSAIINSFSEASDAGDKDLELELGDGDVDGDVDGHSELSTTNSELCDWDPLEEEFCKNIHSGYVNNESAEVMLNGLENDDYKSICRSMRYKGFCRKGESCPWSHKMPRKDGLPSGKVPLYFRLEEEVEAPSVGSCFPALVTTIYSPSKFYIQIPPFNSKNDTGKDIITLKNPFYELQEQLQKDYRNSSGCLTAPLPALGELVIAYTEKLPIQGFYRAMVLQVEDGEEVKVEVFYIDVGNTEWVTESRLRPFHRRFLNTPAQATLCYLSDVTPVQHEKWEEKAKKLFS